MSSDFSKEAFSFGLNWQNFLNKLTDERLKIAEASLLEFMGMSDLQGRSFLDVGCGSGLFSYAAFNLGASQVVSFDVDPFSVKCCRHMHSLADNPPNWEIFQGSILDKGFIGRLGAFDVVYSWGVLHHTGKMWDALGNTAELVKSNGHLYIALYNKILARNGSAHWVHSFWLKVKRAYNRHPTFGIYVLEPLAMSAYIAMLLARWENPISHIKNYKSHRGMTWRTDATDWVGGYPYEFATVEEVFKFFKERFPVFNLVNLKITSGRGLNWFLFNRADDLNKGWDGLSDGSQTAFLLDNNKLGF